MEKQLFLNIDDDLSTTLRKVQLSRHDSLVLVFPKHAMLLANAANLKSLKNQIDALGKKVAILTNDSKGQQYAQEAGFELRTLQYMKKAAPETPKQQRPVSRPEPIVRKRQHILEPVPEIPKKIHSTLQQYPRKTQRSGSSKLITISILIALLVLSVLAFVILPAVNIVVYARTEKLNKDLEVKVDKSIADETLDNMTIPGAVFDADQQQNIQFNSTGKLNVGNKASGKVQIYNFTTRTLKLNAATTTLRVGNNIYRIEADVSGIRPTRYFAGTKNVDPASLIPEIAVIADQPGEGYNLAANTRFEIINQALGNVPNEVYAQNTLAINNGSTRLRTVVSQEDLDNARKTLEKEIFNSTKQQFFSTRKLVLLSGGSRVDVKSVTFSKKAGDEAVNFNGSISARILALAYDPASLEDLLKRWVIKTAGSDRYLAQGPDPETLTVTFRAMDATLGAGSMTVHFEGKVATRIDTQGIASRINGKSEQELREFLLSNPAIDKVDIAFSPFWVKRVPSLSGRVDVQLKTQ